MPRKHVSRTKPGDGSELRPVTGLQWLWRGQFVTQVDGRDYAIDVDYLDWSEKSRLYRDGVQVAVGGNPARFALAELPDTEPAPVAPAETTTQEPRIETKMSLYGMSRAHLVTEAGEQQLRPAPGTAEAWRADLDRDRPSLSRVIGVVSFLVVALALVIEVPQLLEAWSHSDWWAGLTGWRPTAPVTLPPAANGVVTVAGILAGLERALRLQHNWLLDD